MPVRHKNRLTTSADRGLGEIHCTSAACASSGAGNKAVEFIFGLLYARRNKLCMSAFTEMPPLHTFGGASLKLNCNISLTFYHL